MARFSRTSGSPCRGSGAQHRVGGRSSGSGAADGDREFAER